MVRLIVLSALASAVGYVTAVDVFAHFMVANSYAYDIPQWKKDMKDARQMGVDGFSLNWNPPGCGAGPYLETSIHNAYKAAEEMNDEGKPFRLYHSFDFNFEVDKGKGCDFNTTYLTGQIEDTFNSSAAYKWDGKVLVTTFSPEDVGDYDDSFFSGLKKSLSVPMSFAPALTKYTYDAQNNPESAASEMLSDWKSSVDGFKNWQSWPLNRKGNMTTEVDETFKTAMESDGRTGPYIMTISPWQYKYWPDNNPEGSQKWVQYSDTLWADRWSSLLGPDAFKPDIIEIVTWNDWPESHYIRDLFNMDDDSAKDYAEWGENFEAYVEGQNHSPWRIMAKHYIAKLKGQKCPPIMDQVVFWYRTSPKDCNKDVSNYELPENAVFAWALVQAPSTITVTVGGNEETFEADPQGPAMVKVPFPSNLGSGITPEVSITQNGKVVESGKGSKAISGSCPDVPNMNPLVNLVGPGKNSGRSTL